MTDPTPEIERLAARCEEAMAWAAGGKIRLSIKFSDDMRMIVAALRELAETRRQWAELVVAVSFMKEDGRYLTPRTLRALDAVRLAAKEKPDG